MMLRISILESTVSAVTLLLEGKVVGDAVEQVNLSCNQALAKGQRPLDLAETHFRPPGGSPLSSTRRQPG